MGQGIVNRTARGQSMEIQPTISPQHRADSPIDQFELTEFEGMNRKADTKRRTQQKNRHEIETRKRRRTEVESEAAGCCLIV